MSNSVVTEYSDSSGKADSPLVVLVDKDGSVSLERNIIEDLLVTAGRCASVSVVRINEDGKPDDASDHSDDDVMAHVNLTVDAFYEGGKVVDATLIGLHNDHCYTRPRVSVLSDDDPDAYVPYGAPTITKQYIPSSKKITVLESRIISKDKCVQYFDAANARQILKGTDVLGRTVDIHRTEPEPEPEPEPERRPRRPDRDAVRRPSDEARRKRPSRPHEDGSDTRRSVKPLPRKERKPSAQETALLHDMTSLFSAPDVIRRVSVDAKPKEEPKVETHAVAAPALDPPPIVEAVKTDAPTPPEPGDPRPPVSVSPSMDLLAGLHPEEEGLPEDLLRHVAQLVESSENLQEVIDKQVLGKMDDESLKSALGAVPRPEPVVEAPVPQPGSAPPKKEPIKIVRKDGVVITLPPIEAPATRSSKRRSMQNVAAPSDDKADAGGVTDDAQTQGRQAQRILNRSPDFVYDQKDDDAESDRSWNSEDDPERLWCVCKQPHNNRFMICCDTCEDWFHGKCVNVTKALGKEMEIKGIEWRCPNCLSKTSHNNSAVKALQQRSAERTSSKQEDKSGPSDSMSCIACKKPARPNSIFCSDVCIQRHAQESLSSSSSGGARSSKDTSGKPKSETRIIVYERKTGKFLAGPNAPTSANLKTWLQEHPTYEVVKPGSANHSRHLSNVRPKPKLPPPKGQSVLTFNQDKQISFSHPSPKTPTAPSRPASKPVTPTPATLNLKSPTNVKSPVLKTPPPLKSPTTPKPQQKPSAPKTPTTPTTQRKIEHTQKKSSAELVRENVRKGLQEIISLRMNETKDVKLTPEEILKFSIETEYELHDTFKDAGTKYKAKYRSLTFNLKDRKNLTLWQKICNKTITPKQLVQSSAEDLASQELAQWRDKEAKHQLELIKKSELDLLACSKTIVLKTHKGEEVMESRTTGTAELDPNVSVEDLVTELNKSADVAGDSVGGGSRPVSPVVTSHDTRNSSSHYKHSSSSRHKSKSHKSSKSSHSKRNEKSSSRHVSSKDSKSDSRSHHKRSSKDKDRSSRSERSTRRHSSSRKHSSRSRSKSKSKHSGVDKRSKSHDKHSTSPKEDPKSHSKETNQKTENVEIEKKEEVDLMKIEVPQTSVSNEKKTESAEQETKSPRNVSPKTPGTPELNTNKKILGAESDQEPSSTVDSVPSALWTGCINMVDVARFNVNAYEVSGICDDVIYDLDSDLEVVGRINPDTVWDYISKMKKQSSKDIFVVRFVATNDEEKIQYTALYTYLSSRHRLGVIKVNGGSIKDFYILPLSSHGTLHSVLLPINGSGFENPRQNQLIGILVKQRRKRVSQISSLTVIPSKVAKLAAIDRNFASSEGSYTPPPGKKSHLSSTSTVLSSMPLPGLIPTLTSSADDEPYSPGGSDSGSMGHSSSPRETEVSLASTVLQRKMEELNRKIEEEKKQIENISVQHTDYISSSAQDEPYSPSRPMSPPTAEAALPILSNISLPSNIHEILATIQNKTKSMSSENTEPRLPEPYLPPVLSNPVGDVDMRLIAQPNVPAYPAHTESSNKGKLSTLSEAELLSMVPDEVLLPVTKVFPPLPGVQSSTLPAPNAIPSSYKKPRSSYGEPPPPGLDEY